MMVHFRYFFSDEVEVFFENGTLFRRKRYYRMIFGKEHQRGYLTHVAHYFRKEVGGYNHP